MFEAATLKLTGWYLGIVMAVSLVFSVVIYQVNFHEVTLRFESLLGEVMRSNPSLGPVADGIVRAQTEQAAFHMLLLLLYINIFVLFAGGIGSYLLARRTLRPIQKAHNAERRFTSDASHELRTPLATMKAEIEVSLRNPSFDATEARELLESNLEEIDKLIQVTNMLLNLSRLDYDRLEKKRLNIEPLIKDTLKRFKEHSQRFELSLRKAAFVNGNRSALQELITILVDNALKYSHPNTPIILKLFQQGRNLRFDITNSGPTIPANNHEHLFERFYRGDASRTQSGKNGYGLGLAIAKKIVEVHHGTIAVTSRQERTTFRVLLPLHQPARPRPQTAKGKNTTK